ncbi:MAG: hypothetical protein ACRD0P_21725 [Stackebrandtia sp.]
MAYHADVEFLDECSPGLIERNAAEFGRTRDLLVSVEPSVHKARYGTVWESVHRRNFDARLADVVNLVRGLAEGFDKARTALLRYADEVETAKQHLENGVHAEHTLGSLISQVAVPVTRTAQQAEPMRQWDDIRETTGFLDWLAELGMAADSIREDATRAYNQADDAFGRAQSVETAARERCLAELNAAYAMLPDFRGGDFRDAAELAGQIAPLRAEAAQAGTDPHVGLPGSGVKGADFPVAAGAAVSPALQHIRTLLKSLPEGQSPWWHNITLHTIDAERRQWIRDNRELIQAAAAETALPADMIAGIAWREIGGKGYLVDNVAEAARRAAERDWSPVIPEQLPWRFGGERDETSYGPMAVQIRRGAEILGYDPDHLDERQRDEVRSALRDPAQNIFVAAKYLEHLKAASEFANVPAEDMTAEHYEELAARYNGGPYWQGSQAQGYGRDFSAARHAAAEALR